MNSQAITEPINTSKQAIPSLEIALKLGLSEEEYQKICKILNRKPNFTELSIYSVMWSEHCSYKNSILWLKKLPRDSERMLAKAGEENAGLVDLGDGLACCFKIESHNHPSAIEPYQGAATGVGGINRDIFTMGARPVAQLNSLRFGNPTTPKTKNLFKGVVKGIGDYGNAFGIPTVGGEIYFDECYSTNPLVNAFSAGIVETGKTASAIAYGKENPVFIVGSATGKDGIHGATFASEEISGKSAEKLPSVQVGDPFYEKLLLEATLEIISSEWVIGVQDMGAAGIICSTSEMSAKGKHGMKIFLDKVPLRQENMEPFEILLSESQERMLVIGKKGFEQEIKKIFTKWDLNCIQIGEVTEGGLLEFFVMDEKVAEVPAESLVLGGGAPVYSRKYLEPLYFKESQKFTCNSIPDPKGEELIKIAKFLSSHPNLCSRNWVKLQYDSLVGTAYMNTNHPSDAAVVRIKNNSKKAIALTLDCNSRYVNSDPFIGASIAVCESARNIACSGGEAIAITNCLNFGNPYNEEVYWQFVETIRGMKSACEKYKTPVTGGNVSFYNQSETGPVFPTPVIGMLGILDDKDTRMTLDFKNTGDLIYLLGRTENNINSSEYLYSYCKVKLSPPPFFNLEDEYRLYCVIVDLFVKKNNILNNQTHIIHSAHDLSEGGLWTALMESAVHSNFGFSVTTSNEIRKDAFLFGESQGRVMVSISPKNKVIFENFLSEKQQFFTLLGEVTKSEFQVDNLYFGNVAEYTLLYSNSLSKIMET